MILFDVSILVYAHRAESIDHESYRAWLKETMGAPQAFGLSDLVLSGFLRVVTNPKSFKDPTPPAIALEFVERLRNRPNSVTIAPGPRHWDIFTRLCRETGAKGTMVPDAFFAALAIESGSEWITTDRDYARFPGLRWRHPLVG